MIWSKVNWIAKAFLIIIQDLLLSKTVHPYSPYENTYLAGKLKIIWAGLSSASLQQPKALGF